MLQLKKPTIISLEKTINDDIKKVVADVIAQTGASGMKDMGKVMGICAIQLARKADNKIVSGIVKELLG
ncbi:MAG: GatB/YqeY domain-containing protein [Saprospiraceae bacterium]|nr:GatB/YqeY domain-containing protein [Saprospiraceae bacterium]